MFVVVFVSVLGRRTESSSGTWAAFPPCFLARVTIAHQTELAPRNRHKANRKVNGILNCVDLR